MNDQKDVGGDDFVDRQILEDCVKRLRNRDPDAGFDLAQYVVGELPNNDVAVLLALIEGLIRQSEQLGSSHASEYLENMWPKMRGLMIKRLIRKGCTNTWNIQE